MNGKTPLALIAGLALSIEQTLLKEIDEMPEKEADRLLARQTAGL